MKGCLVDGGTVAAEQMQEEGGDEEKRQGDAEGVGVKGGKQTARIGTPRLVRPVRVPGLGRSALEQEGRQHHVGGHLQKLAFPVLEDGRRKIAAVKIAQEGERRSSMIDERLIVGRPAGEPHAEEGEGEKAYQRDREPVVAETRSRPRARSCLSG